MSSTLVRRNFMSCSDLQETTTTLIKLKVLAATPEKTDRRPTHGGWDFLRPPPPTEHCSQDHENDGDKTTAAVSCAAIRTPPYSYFPTRLSQESLELCTENLGSESGTTDTVFESDILPEPSRKQTPAAHNSAVKLRKSPKKGKNFPPPLTTMSGSNPLQVTRHVEDGRLIIEAVERPLKNGVLQAERGGGRLRLSFLKPTAEEGGGNEAPEVEEDAQHGGVNGEKYQWVGRCKEGGHGGGGGNVIIRASDHDSNWNKPALWVA